MLLTADVTKLKCIVFGSNVQLIEAGNYGIKCNNNLIQDTINQGQFLLDLLNVSPTVCKSLEIAVLAYNENKYAYCLTCTSPCTREEITENV